MSYDYVIYHRNCMDGFSGFFILTTTNTIKDTAIVYPDVPSAKDVPPHIEGKNVIIIDVAYKAEILEQILKKAKKVTFIDHHVSIRDDILALNIEKPHEIIYDVDKSGASLVWHYFFKNKKMPLFIRYIEDNDIGAWKLKHTHPFILGLDVNYSLEPSRRNLQKWKKLLDKREVFRLIKKGKIYEEYKESLLDWNVKRYSLEAFPSEKIYNEFPDSFTKPGQYSVAVYCGSGCPSASSLGVKFMEKVKCDFVMMWVYHMDKKEYVISFRSSSEDKDIDVGSIAKLFNGGGHRSAAAGSFSSNQYNIQDLFFSNSLPRAHK